MRSRNCFRIDPVSCISGNLRCLDYTLEGRHLLAGRVGGRDPQRAALGELIGEARGLRQPVAAAEAEHPLSGLLKANAMPHRDVDRGDTVPGAHHQADKVEAAPELSAGAGLGRRLGVLSHQAGLGDADRGQVQEQTQVTGDAEASRMGEAMAVHEEKVRHSLQLLEGAGQGGYLPEGQEARYVGEGDRLLDDVLLDECQFGIGENHNSSAGQGRLAAVRPVHEGDVGGGDVANALKSPFSDDLGSEPSLDGCRLGRGYMPGMQVTQAHEGGYCGANGRGRPSLASLREAHCRVPRLVFAVAHPLL